MKKCLQLLAFVSLVMISAPGYGQRTPYVKWQVKIGQVSAREIMLTIDANVAPGWHLYSQHLKEGGPLPTRFNFSTSDEYIPVGLAEEKGKQTKRYDEIYEMDIIWYSETVSFQQKFRLNKLVTRISGEVEYMVCNDQICVPDKMAFFIDVDMLKSSP